MGLNDRDYMYSQNQPQQDGRKMLLSLIVVNLVIYFLARPGNQLFSTLILHISGRIGFMNVLQLFTAGFVSRDFWGLFFDMWGLYIFGSLVAPKMSGPKIFLLYAAGTVCGNLLFLLLHIGRTGIMFGALGAVAAMMIAAAALEPERKFMLIFMPFTPIKTTTLIVVYTVFSLLMVAGKSAAAVFNLTQLAGFISGYILLKIWFGSRLPWDPLRPRKNKSSDRGSWQRPTTPPPAPKRSAEKNSGDFVSQKELDELLDKLSRTGINSLSEYEQERLRKARRQMRGEE